MHCFRLRHSLPTIASLLVDLCILSLRYTFADRIRAWKFNLRFPTQIKINLLLHKRLLFTPVLNTY